MEHLKSAGDSEVPEVECCLDEGWGNLFNIAFKDKSQLINKNKNENTYERKGNYPDPSDTAVRPS